MNSVKILLIAFCLLVVPFTYAQEKEQDQDWVAFSQFLDLEVNKNLDFELSASVKTNVDEAFSKAGLWVRVDNKKVD